jgi:hypothetical protein
VNVSWVTRNTYKIFVVVGYGKLQLEQSWGNGKIIKIDLKEINRVYGRA